MNEMKNCRVVLKPCTPKLRTCYVSLEQCAFNKDTVKRKLSPSGSKHAEQDVPCTPNIEPALSTELRRAITEKNILTTKTKSRFISALNELEKANNETSRQHRKRKTMAEIIDSEIVYLKQLENIIKYFKEPLTNKYILSEEEVDKLFSKIIMLYDINKEFLKLMKEHALNIGAAFKKIAPFLKIYSTYAYEYKMISEFLQALVCKNEEFSEFIKAQETRPEVQMQLSSLLITPIQRIPRYCLLLKQVLLYTTEFEEDYQILKESLELVEKSAKHIDTLVEERENSETLLQIQNSFVNNKPLIIKPGRKLIKAGRVLRIEEDGVGTIMYLIVMTDILMFCKIKKENLKSKSALKCSFILPLNKCKFNQNFKLRKILIKCEDDNIEFFIETPKEFNHWIDILKETHKNIIYNRHTLRKESSSRRPAHKDELDNYNEIDISYGKPQQKRKRVTANLVIQNQENSENQHKRPGALLLSKRRCIRDVYRKNTNAEITDSLFPLRNHYIRKTEDICTKIENKDTDGDDVDEKEDVFVFGKSDNPNRGFNFGIANFFTNVGNSLKRFFRLK